MIKLHLQWWRAECDAYMLSELTPARIAQARYKLKLRLTKNGKPISPANINRYLATLSIACGVAGALAGGGSLWLVGEVWKRLRGVEAMGLGDVKMMLGVGMLLGWRLTLLSIFFGAFSGAVIGMFVIAKQKDKTMQAQIPFGIFLGIGAIAALLFGSHIVEWYAGQFR